MFKDGTLHPPYNFEVEEPREKTVTEYLLNKIKDHCDRGFGARRWLTNPVNGEFISIAQVEPSSKRIASALYKRGMRHGDILLYSSHEPVRLHTFFLGVWRANGTVRASYPEDSVDTMIERIIDSKAKFFLCDSVNAHEVQAAVERISWSVEILVFGETPKDCTNADDLFQDDGQSCPPLLSESSDIALMLATSGTTGTSKGCMHTHTGLKRTFAYYELLNRPDDDSLVESFMLIMGKQTHITGSCFPFAALIAKTSLLMMRDITKENIFHAVHHYRPFLVFGFPKFLLYLVNDPDAKNYDFTSVKAILTGGCVCTPSFIATIKTLNENIVFSNAYGMTECGIFASAKNVNPNGNSGKAFGVWPNVPDFSVGKLLPGTLLQVRHAETNEPLGPNQSGELCFKNPLLCAGYYKNPEETKKTFPDGWIRTGDIGYFDESGFIFVVDRLKEIFKYYNNHISPSELEDVIHRHPAVDSVSVVGVPDPEGGDTIPRAFVTLKDPKAKGSDIRKFANENLAEYKQLRGGLIVLYELPLGRTGKINIGLLKQVQISFPESSNL